MNRDSENFYEEEVTTKTSGADETRLVDFVLIAPQRKPNKEGVHSSGSLIVLLSISSFICGSPSPLLVFVGNAKNDFDWFPTKYKRPL